MTDAALPSRRQVLAAGACWTGAGLALGVRASSQGQAQAQASPADAAADADRLDAGLARLHAGYPNTNVHRSNHVPMVIEALSVLGRADAIAPWLDENLERYSPDATPGKRVDAERWRESLGKDELFTDWRALFLDELRSDDWRIVLRRWVPRFVPGLAGAATHGVIRTGHATRALVARDNAIRRTELATGLAYWAVNYEELPWDGSVELRKSVAEALSYVETRRPAHEPPEGNIVTGLRVLADTPSFRPVAGWIDVRDPAHTLSKMASAFARLYLRNPERRIAFTHTITAPSALRLLAPHLDEENVREATRYAWQAAAGLYVVYGDPRGRDPEARDPLAREALIANAVQNGGAHSIKLTEACFREAAFTDDAIFCAVARDAGEAMSG